MQHCIFENTPRDDETEQKQTKRNATRAHLNDAETNRRKLKAASQDDNTEQQMPETIIGK